jgi:hypothetical protein
LEYIGEILDNEESEKRDKWDRQQGLTYSFYLNEEVIIIYKINSNLVFV